MQMVGLLAVEMFLSKKGELLVNEVAPRPHNSGHQSIEGNSTSQYEQHLRAILNLPIGNTAIIQPSVMVNLLGEKGYQGKAIYQGVEEVLKIDGAHIHLYGKYETRPFRKMGHVNIVAPSLEEAKMKAKKVKSTLKVIA
jgi:5-(carboxyamino)imidazole ribonucleotide synthase